jgi:DNA-binding PadR family transcriptional regulator
MKHLTRADEILLVAVLCLGDDAYSTTIRDEVDRRSGKSVTVGSLWVSLDHLAGGGYLRKASRRMPGSKGGRPRIYYRLTPKGVRALRRVREEQARLWEGVPDPDAYRLKRSAERSRDPRPSPRV